MAEDNLQKFLNLHLVQGILEGYELSDRKTTKKRRAEIWKAQEERRELIHRAMLLSLFGKKKTTKRRRKETKKP